ncbi:MAG: HNH endonuclease [Erysipelotrichaceae bacterium]|nr:HNH endonuclease [Erysipelotrichaceae bacterium]
MNEYLEKWLKVIDGMRNVNSYKLSWGRSLVELCHSTDSTNEQVVFTFDQISEHFLKYYWNQTYFFKLYQGPARTKPVIQQITEEMILLYQTKEQSTLPVWFDIAKVVFMKDPKQYQKFLERISKAMTQDVSWRFSIIDEQDIILYVLDIENRTVSFTQEQCLIVKDHAFVLSQLLNYRWAQLLEKFNQSPRIASKVKGMSDEQLRRNSLSKFKHALLKQFPDGVVRDFYTDDILDPNDISIDHVIPWSFMYSDDIWNLVITSKSHNSSKSNNKTTQDYIDRLKQRNLELENIVPDSFKIDLIEAKNRDFVDKFYFQFRL